MAWTVEELNDLRTASRVRAADHNLEALARRFNRPRADIDLALWALTGASADAALARLASAAPPVAPARPSRGLRGFIREVLGP